MHVIVFVCILQHNIMKTKIAYILSQFPEIHETFILREILELKRNKINLAIFSLKKCKDKIIHPQAKALMDETYYSPLIFSWNIIKAKFYFLFTQPLKLFNVFFYLIRHNYKSVELLIKSLGVLPISLYFAKEIQHKGIEHIHAHWATIPTTSAVIISQMTGIPFSFTAHAWDIFIDQTMLAEKVKRAQFVFTCTGYNKKFLNSLLEKKYRDKVILNYHGIDFEKLEIPSREKDKYFVFSIGRLCEQKGFAYLIKSCKILIEKGYDIKCIIVGEGPDRKKLEKLIMEEEMEDVVLLKGIQPHSAIFEFFSKAAIFVLPCVIAKNGDRDGIPNVIIESLAVQIPVISTNVSGIPEIIVNNQTGLVIPPRDEKSLANAMIFLLQNSEKQKMFAKNGRNLVEEKFDIKKNVADLVNILLNYGKN